MLCIASFIVLLILSVFSARFRPYVGEAYDCVFRRLTFRPCNTGFDVKVKSKIAVELSKRSERLARLFQRYFELISWIFVLSFFVSLLWTLRGGYLFWTTGSCNGLNQGGFCVLDPSGANNEVSSTGIECRTGGDPTGNLTLTGVNIEPKPIVFIGCYACKYSKETYPLINNLAENYSVPVEYVFYPTHAEAEYLMAYDYVIKNTFPEKYPAWVDAMYQLPIEDVDDEASVIQLAGELGIDTSEIQTVATDSATQTAVQRQTYEIDKTGIYGTPTVFINEKPVVGPKPYRVYRIMLNNSLF
jgi:hypothetical protein